MLYFLIRNMVFKTQNFTFSDNTHRLTNNLYVCKVYKIKTNEMSTVSSGTK